MPLQHRHRPKKLGEVVGNSVTLKSLEAALSREDDKPHAMLFTGPSGTGKTTLARIVAKRLGCVKTGFHELDTSSYRGIDGIREIRSKMQFRPTAGTCHVWFLDECHGLTTAAQEALLKALEDTPDHVYFLLATTEPTKLKITLKRRCAEYTLTPLSEDKIGTLLKAVAKKEGKTLPKDLVSQICADCLGSAGIALGILDKVIDLDESEMVEAAKLEAENKEKAITLCRALINQSSWKQVAKILKELDEDPETVRRIILSYAQSTLLRAGSATAAAVLEAFIEPVFHSGKPGLTLAAYEVVHGSGVEY